MIALLTGSTGFIGSYLLEALISEGFKIHCLLRQESILNTVNNTAIKKFYINYHNLSSLLKSSAFENVNYVFHLAGVTTGATYKDFLAGNLTPTANLLKVIYIKKIKLKRFILVSSLAAAGPADSIRCPVDINRKPQPIEFYGMSKLLAEKEVLKYNSFIPSTIIRPAPVYGPKDKDFFKLFKQVNRGFNVSFGNQRSYTSIIYVKDLINGLLQVISNDSTLGRIYFLCNEQPVCWKELYRTTSDLMHKKIKLKLNLPEAFCRVMGILGDVYMIVTGRKTLINSQKAKLASHKFWVCSNKQAKSDFNFRTFYSIRQGLKETIQWNKQRRLLR